MELAAAEARYEELHEELPYHDGTFKRWSAKRSKDYPYHFRDGVRLWVSKSDIPGDDFLTPPQRAMANELVPAVEDLGDLHGQADQH